MQDKSQWYVIAHYLQVSCLYKHGDFLFIAMINNSIHTSAVRSSSCDRRALTSQGRPPGEQCQNNDDDIDAFTREYYIGMCRISRTVTIHTLDQ